jgi:hypothetical protein
MRKWLISLPILVVIGSAVWLLLANDTISILLDQTPGYFDRERFTGVVEQVRLLELQPGQDHFLRLDDLNDPQSIRHLKAGERFRRGQGAGNVWARRSSDNQLTVVIETRDQGHSGSYGFAYSDVPLSAKPFGKPWFTIDVPGPLTFVQPKMRIDDHWWKVLYNLD